MVETMHKLQDMTMSRANSKFFHIALFITWRNLAKKLRLRQVIVGF